MPEAPRIAELAEAIADGHPVDWISLADGAVTDDERAAVEAFREIAGIGEIFATVGNSCGGGSRLDVDLLPGSTWGGLRVLERVGRGRYGEVYRAWDPTLDRHVALKLLNRDDSDGVIETQVVEEGRLMARVRHPNVVAIHGAQRIDGVTGLWMEFVEGRTLAEELAEHGPLGPEALVAVGTQLGRALAAVHAAGLVHRDVKRRTSFATKPAASSLATSAQAANSMSRSRRARGSWEPLPIWRRRFSIASRRQPKVTSTASASCCFIWPRASIRIRPGLCGHCAMRTAAESGPA